MKSFTCRATLLALSLLVTLNSTILPASALYRGVLGEVYSAYSRQIGAGVDLTLYSSLTDGLNERAYVFEYRPGEGALPIVAWGDKLVGSNRVTSLAEHELARGNNVIGGINGDFYSFYTGIPMGAVIRDGRIISDDDKNNAIGFTSDGETLIGDPGISFTVVHKYKSEAESDISEMSLDETKEAETTESETTSIDESLDDTQSETEIISEEDTSDTSEVSELDKLDDPLDTESETSIDKESELEPVDEYISETLPVSYFNKYPTEWGAYLLDDSFSDSTRSSKSSLEIVIKLDHPDMHARAGETVGGTIVAMNRQATNTPIATGSIVISVCETSSYFASYSNVKLGDRIEITFSVANGWEKVTTAIGGSDLIVKDGKINEAAIDEYHEKVANPRTAVGVRADGTAVFFAVDGRSNESYGMRLVSLAKTLLSFGCVYAMNLDGGGSTTAVARFPEEAELQIVNTPSDSAERSVSNALLLIDNSLSDGVARYLIPNETDPVILPGESYVFKGELYDSALKKVELAADEEPPQVRISFDSSRLSYYTSETLPDLGNISEDGLTYTAGNTTGEIPLLFTAEYGEKTLTGRVILFVANAPDTVDISLGSTIVSSDDGFDVEFDAYYMGKPVPARADQLTYALNDNEVKISHAQSDDTEDTLADCSIGRITKDGRFLPYSDAVGSAWLTIALDGIPMSQTLIIYGEPRVTALGTAAVEYDFTSEDANDTEYISSLPLESAQSLDLYAADTSLELTATVTDAEGVDHVIKYVKAENEPVQNGIVHYRAPLDSKYLSLSSALNISAAANAGKSGKLDIESVKISFDDTETIFYDTYGHWARQSINSLYRDKIIGGEEYDGKLRFAPNRDLSRAEFAVMICRSLGYDTSIYDDAPKFDDNEAIPAWAAGHIRAVSANKIMNGKDMPNGTLCFDPNGKITRQEIMQVIGNIIKSKRLDTLYETINAEDSTQDEALTGTDTLDKTVETIAQEVVSDAIGADASIDITFADKDDIAAWAYENVLITLEAGIIAGYEDNTIRPTRNVTRAEVATIILRAQDHLAYLD